MPKKNALRQTKAQLKAERNAAKRDAAKHKAKPAGKNELSPEEHDAFKAKAITLKKKWEKETKELDKWIRLVTRNTTTYENGQFSGANKNDLDDKLRAKTRKIGNTWSEYQVMLNKADPTHEAQKQQHRRAREDEVRMRALSFAQAETEEREKEFWERMARSMMERQAQELQQEQQAQQVQQSVKAWHENAAQRAEHHYKACMMACMHANDEEKEIKMHSPQDPPLPYQVTELVQRNAGGSLVDKKAPIKCYHTMVVNGEQTDYSRCDCPGMGHDGVLKDLTLSKRAQQLKDAEQLVVDNTVPDCLQYLPDNGLYPNVFGRGFGPEIGFAAVVREQLPERGRQDRIKKLLPTAVDPDVYLERMAPMFTKPDHVQALFQEQR